jgi:hypothetical protein
VITEVVLQLSPASVIAALVTTGGERCQDAVGSLSKFCECVSRSIIQSGGQRPRGKSQRCFGARFAFDRPTGAERPQYLAIQAAMLTQGGHFRSSYGV